MNKYKSIILKLKSFIYRNFGLYLAHKEELNYLTSKEYWKKFNSIYKNKKKNKNLTPETIQSILLGLWQAEHKLYRKFNFKRYLK